MKRLIVVLGLLWNCMSAVLFAQTPVEINGKLQLKGVQLSNEDGYPVQLRGISSHGLQWFGNCINQQSINTLKDDWGADVIRLAMYVEEGGYINDREGFRNSIKEKADMIIEAGLYVIIDWHVHIPGDPNAHKGDAMEFFDYFSDLYKDVPNVIYEICNEPNKIGDSSWTTTIRPYAEDVIPVIRANSPDAIVLVGTPIWSSKPGDILNNPLSPENAENSLYSFHFYSGSHYTQAYINQFSDKVPIFMNEWGTSINKGSTGNDYANTQAWFDVMAGNNKGKQLMSWCNWSFCDKVGETSAALQGGGNCNPDNGDYNSVTESGAFVKNGILNPGDNFITAPLTAPRFAVQPFDQHVVLGTNAYFRSLAFAGGSVSYQWYKDDVAISNAQEADLTLSDVSLDDQGIYKVIASNQFGDIVSKEVELSFSNQVPRSGDPVVLPGIIEVEEFDLGDPHEAYLDVAFPPDLVGQITEVEAEEDNIGLTGLGYNDWMEYTVTVAEDGYYVFKAHVYSEEGADIPQFWVALDGDTKTRIVDIPHTDYEWKDVYTDTVQLEKGTFVLRLLIEERLGVMNFPTLNFDHLEAVRLNIDCNGIEDGEAFIDSCGICVGGNTGLTASVDSDNDGVYDCNDSCPNDPNKTEEGICGCGVEEGQCYDCNGEFGGTARVDDCNICSGGSTGIEPNSTCTDCYGTINGTAEIDDCNVCAGGATGIVRNSACTDCSGELYGDASIDQCGVCSGGNTGLEANETCIDCAGIINGDAEVDECGICNGDGTSCSGVQTPYKGIVRQIPGLIEAEEYDGGGQDAGYYDTDGGNNGSGFRNDDVDMDISAGNYAIGWIADGEWLKYTVNVQYAGDYRVIAHVATPEGGKTFNVLIDGELLLDDWEMTNSGSYSTFIDNENSITISSAGEMTLELYFNGYGYNVDWISFEPLFEVDCEGVVGGSAEYDDCGVCNGNNACYDCNGDVNGTAYIDNCENCVGGNTSENACIKDCNGEWGGSAFIDSCYRCVGGSTGKAPILNPDACITALQQEELVEFSITPNPFNTSFAVKGLLEFDYAVYALTGETLLRGTSKNGSVDIGNSLAKGVYIIQIRTEQGTARTTLIKE